MKYDVVVVGAGAAGLMAARELSKAGKKVIILEARDRIGGRIFSLDEREFGFPAQGGAEFVHGEAPLTKRLIKEAGLTFIPEEGEIWSQREGELILQSQFLQNNGALIEKLDALTEDMSISDFFDKYFTEPYHQGLRNMVFKIVEGYDAADPKLISTFALRDEWLTDPGRNDGKIKEGYGKLLDFLESECKAFGVSLCLNTQATEIKIEKGEVVISTNTGLKTTSSKAIVAAPLPLLNDIEFGNVFKVKKELISRIGYGSVIKILFKFKNRWWSNITDKDLSKMSFLLTNEKFMTWWTQYPQINPILVGWMAGPEASKYNDYSENAIVALATVSLSNIFKIDEEKIKNDIDLVKVFNWSADPFAKGAYSYSTFKTGDAYTELAKPIDNKIFFAGEALYSEHITATVEGALGSGSETANLILKSS